MSERKDVSVDEWLASAKRCRVATERLKAGDIAGLNEIVQLSDSGYTPAQVVLGWAYETGRMVEKNVDTAARWYAAAANGGYLPGQLWLGKFLIRRGDAHAGAQWVERAAAADYPPALYMLAKCYKSGCGVSRDIARAESLLTRAAEMDHPFAQGWLADKRFRGAEGMRGRLKALLWLLRVPFLAVRYMRDDKDVSWREP